MIGTYTVTLIASDVSCSDSIHKTIVVIDLTAVKENQLSSFVNVAYDNGQVYLVFSLSASTQVNIKLYNMLGEEISAQNNLHVKNDRIKLDIPASSTGIYVAVSEMTNALISKKIFLPSK